MILRNYLFIFFTILFTLSCAENPPEEEDLIYAIEDTLLYSKDPNGYNELYKLENGIETLLISDPNYDYWWAKVSPDKAKMLVYRSPVNPAKNHDDYENSELILADIDGKNQKVLIAKNQYGWNAHGVCRWNKDGSKILMCADLETNGVFQWRLVLTDANGQNPKILSDRWAIDCNFSIDNSQIVFMGYKDNNLSFDFTKLELQRGDFIENLDTVINIQSLTSNTTRDHDPSFSPNNQTIIFSAGNSLYTDVDLILFDVISKTETKLLDDSGANGGSMCWSTNGKNIFFHNLDFLKTPFRIKCISVESGMVNTILKIDTNDHGFYHPEAY